jgi:hypothetical protein
MNKLLFVAASIAIPFVSAHAAKSCEELKAEIVTKVEAKGVKGYTLEIVPNDQTGDKKVVGSCDGGTKKIVYSKGTAAQAPRSDAGT